MDGNAAKIKDLLMIVLFFFKANETWKSRRRRCWDLLQWRLLCDSLWNGEYSYDCISLCVGRRGITMLPRTHFTPSSQKWFFVLRGSHRDPELSAWTVHLWSQNFNILICEPKKWLILIDVAITVDPNPEVSDPDPRVCDPNHKSVIPEPTYHNTTLSL